MGETTEREYYEIMLDGCKSILNSETDDEVQIAREEINSILVERFGYDEVSADEYMTRVDKWVDLVENGEMTTDEMMQAINERFPETEAITEIQSDAGLNSLQTGATIGLGFGAFFGTLMGCYALKKQVLKNKKNRSR